MAWLPGAVEEVLSGERWPVSEHDRWLVVGAGREWVTAQEAELKLREGVFRKHMHQRYGVRDSAYYAITDDEWPAVKAGLLRRLEPSADRLA